MQGNGFSEKQWLHITNVNENIDNWLRITVPYNDTNRPFYMLTNDALRKAYANRKKDERFVGHEDLVDTYRSVVGESRRLPAGFDMVASFKPLFEATFRLEMPESVKERVSAPLPEKVRGR